MPKIKTNDIMTYYEISGKGIPLLLIHGAWVDHEMWKMQVEHFSLHHKVVTYDVRGHRKYRSSQESHIEDLKKQFCRLTSAILASSVVLHPGVVFFPPLIRHVTPLHSF